ncbi:hemerythrin [Sulfuricaulis limicola]|uniref:Hemerythrin n=1 Tax=Sulfuricaulis limicola TaxID=1620215 RepID=A0A1B4XCR8_9GAMM|nr:bacteriohemerythrin [Sulfuricaulis limicola]BAV32575.1 hemerythrin [Sulfuricaulis limicola]
MSLIEWDEKFSVGVAAVDHEHRELIGLVNETYDRLQRPDAGVTVPDFLGEIYARISAHFALEENLMRAKNYAQFAEHKADHERLLDEIRDIMDDYEDGDSEAFDEQQFALRLGEWFTGHFRTHDARLHRNLD